MGVINLVNTIKLEYLKLTTFVDAIYFAGIDGKPIHGLIAGETGVGKTWCTKSISQQRYVQYLSANDSPSEHRKVIIDSSRRTKLLINDDLGLMTGRIKEYFATFIMAMDGAISHSHFKTKVRSDTSFSLILCMTKDYIEQNRAMLEGMGVVDRMMPLCLGVSDDTRREYQEHQANDLTVTKDPKQRVPVRSLGRDLIKNPFPLLDYNISPRNIGNLKIIQKYLSDNEMEELINILHSQPYAYSI